MILSKDVNNKKFAPKLTFFNNNKKRDEKDLDFDIENWLWKSNFGNFWQLATNPKFNHFLCCFFNAKIFLCIPHENSKPHIAILFIFLFFSRDRNYGIPQGPFTHMHHLLYSCWVFLQFYLAQFSTPRFLPIPTFMVYMKQQLHQLVPKTLPYQVIYHTIDRRNTSCLVGWRTFQPQASTSDISTPDFSTMNFPTPDFSSMNFSNPDFSTLDF